MSSPQTHDNALKRIRPWSHTWASSANTEAVVHLALDENRVQHFRNLNRMLGEPKNWPGCYFDEYAAFWTWMGGHEEIRELVCQLGDVFRRASGEPSPNSRAYAEFIKQFVSSFPYESDDKSIGHKEYGRFPIETLYDGEGDCECLSFLLASLLVHAGFRVALLGGYTKPGKQSAHAAVGLAIKSGQDDDVIHAHGADYVYCEAVSNDRVGKCGFDFQLFLADAEVLLIPTDYRWDGQPHGWQCPHGCGEVKPWLHQCPSCDADSTFQTIEHSYGRSADWDSALRGFLDYMRWLRSASQSELALELTKFSASDIWYALPSGNKSYLEKTLAVLENTPSECVSKYLEGARHHLLSAWPHIVAAVFCHKPDSADRAVWTCGAMSWIGMGVYEMSNRDLAGFARRILSDTICKRITGFSSGSRLAIGRILDAYERYGDAYMTEKRESIENILVKVVIPQVFTLLAREEFVPVKGWELMTR